MNSEEILKAARKQSEVNSEGEYEKDLQRKGIIFAYMIAALICTFMLVSELLMRKTVDFGKYAIFFLFSCVSDLYYGYKIRKRKVLVRGIVVGIITSVFLIAYIGDIFL